MNFISRTNGGRHLTCVIIASRFHWTRSWTRNAHMKVARNKLHGTRAPTHPNPACDVIRCFIIVFTEALQWNLSVPAESGPRFVIVPATSAFHGFATGTCIYLSYQMCTACSVHVILLHFIIQIMHCGE